MAVNIVLPRYQGWTVVKVPSTHEKLTVDGEQCLGAAYFKTKTIYVDNELLPEALLDVMRHEISHAIIAETKFDSTDLFEEEDICNFAGMYGQMVCDLADEAIRKLEEEEDEEYDEDLEDDE